MSDWVAASLNIKGSKGALVGDVVEGGPADKAGIKRGDVIVEFEGKEIKGGQRPAWPWLPGYP